MTQESLNPYAKSVRIRIPSARTNAGNYLLGITEKFGK